MASDKLFPQDLEDDEKCEIIELACQELDSLTRAFNLIAEVCDTFETAVTDCELDQGITLH